VAALLHDIGKIGVPDAILLKPGPLTPEEWKVMETHDRIGIEIINSAFNCTELNNIVRYHHAKFGEARPEAGMPCGQEIPLRARILTIADAYDAMVSDRVYRKGMTQEAAFEELRSCSPSQFDAELVDRFIQVLSARDRGQAPKPVSESTEVVLGLGLAVERLTAALESGDLGMVTAMAQRLQSVARKYDLEPVAKLAEEAGELAKSEADVEKMLDTVRGLVAVCQSASTDSADSRPPARKV
jgi:hypothetical protein